MNKFPKIKVVKGAGRGRQMGIPTINFDPNAVSGVDQGIYICRVIFDDEKGYWGAMHFGPRPVFDESELTLEATLFDFKEDGIIPEFLDLEIWGYIREVKDFESVEQMLLQIEKDIAFAKEKINEYSQKAL